MHKTYGLVFALVLGACKDDDPGQSGGSGSSDSGAETSSSGAPDGSSSGDESSTSGASGGSSTGTPEPTEVTYSGVIQDYFLGQPIAGAEISVLELPEFSAVSDAEGNWMLENLPTNTFMRVLVAESETYWGAVIPTQTGIEPEDAYRLSQVSLEVVELQENALLEQNPEVDVDETKAAFLIALVQNSATGAVVEIDPPPPPGTFYAPDAGGDPILDQNVIEWQLYPVAVVFNLEPGDAGAYTITVTHPERECTVDDPEPPTFGRHINLIRVDCPPPA